MIEFTLKCVQCKHRWKFTPPPDYPKDEIPMCPLCMSPATVIKVLSGK